ncbi:THO complex subunit 5B isoform X2 [Impatiens glandulifera]|uniref:THO complex subunit 5B isoform X2 n=1 Tax=Impatiens glandulifera TaxID=253017 RepID=UPI001FB1980F|nr:THO complex subunit 5B isoform X2 [Impatiens glandulifera]
MDTTMEDGEMAATTTTTSVPELELHAMMKKSPFDTLYDSRKSAEEIVAKMLSIKRESKSKSELRELATQMFLSFVNMRQSNRAILLEEDRVKAETERAKAPVDFTTLQLHNLMYEKNHYMKAIKACKDFRSKHPDIELVAEEEFFRDAPADIQSSLISNESDHNLMLKRLNFELFQRKELCKLQEKLEQEKHRLFETIANRKKFVSSLPSLLKSLKKVSLPVQHQLGMPHTKKLKQHQYAELLPPPLYIIYSQMLAQKEAFGEKIDVEITGSLKDAQAFSQQQANKENDNSKVEDDAPEDEDDGQRRRKRPKKVPAKENLDQSEIYQTHPLKITLHVYDDVASDSKPAKLVSLKFDYLWKLKVVCVGIEGSNGGPENNILCNLFPDDSGLDIPVQSAKLSIGGAMVFDEKRTSRPYKWVQHLAGIDFLPEISPQLTCSETIDNGKAKQATVVSGLSLYRQQNRVHTVVQQIRTRRKAQIALAEQLDLLLKLKWPNLACKDVPWALHAPLCSIVGWSPVRSPDSHERSPAIADIEQAQTTSEVSTEKRSGNGKEEMESVREDGELPSLIPVVSSEVEITPSKISELEHIKQMSLISKNMVSPINMAKSQSFKKNEDDIDLIMDSDSDIEGPALVNQETEKMPAAVGNSWVQYGMREYCLVLSRITDKDKTNVKLEAKVSVSMEYPLRPPLFALSFSTPSLVEKDRESNGIEWYNELRAMEAEVNAHILKSIPTEQENFILSHQLRFLAMLFDFYVDEESQSALNRKMTNVMDVGLSNPVSGGLLARSYRGRDRRKMISWKDDKCTSGYPY